MKFGLTMCSYAYNEERSAVITRSLNSLLKTNLEGVEKPVFRFTYKPATFHYNPFFDLLKEKFELVVTTDPPDIPTVPKMWQEVGMRLLQEYQDVTHLVFLWDDFIYNPEWLRELQKLIDRHPNAIAWSVYRSAYTYYHRIIGGDGTDVLMTMHDGIGCVTRNEWQDYSKCNWEGAPDIEHAGRHPGERWATSKDYAQNLCPHPGIETVDCAINFIGE